MAVTYSTRLGVVRWSSDSDPFARGQLDITNQNLEDNAAKYTQGTTLPTASAAFARSFFYKTDSQILYYFVGTDSSGTWVPIGNLSSATPASLTFGGSGSAGSSQLAARADHVHAVPAVNLSDYVAKATVDAKGDLLAASANDTVTRLAVGTNGQILTANSSTATGLQWVTLDDTTKIAKSTITAKGDIVAGSGASIPSVVAVGTNGQVLSANSSTATGLQWVTLDDTTKIAKSLVDAKGDLVTATANDTPARLGVGTNGQVLTADSTAATGLKWTSPPSAFETTFLLMGA